ncbi:MAG: glycosyltransferase family 2 protein [Bacteroidetes bacterium]|nr:glycosyltransferase family 2 protein [Bacteroidota bacterium]
MADEILVSICIPAYKRIDYLQRLLDSIQIQTFRNFEVIVTDDSPDDSVKNLCTRYYAQFTLLYFKNSSTLGTPENWNESIRRSSGAWIKLMHDDDWFVEENSLKYFVDLIDKNQSSSFIFCAYTNVYAESGLKKNIFPARHRLSMLEKNAAVLLAGNCIGPPSVVLHKKNTQLLYDARMKWLVDIDFYIRYLASTHAEYIDKSLVNIGISETQVTKNAFRNREVEIPEHFLLMEKTGTGILKNITIFDAWWRLIRNLKIKSIEEIRQSGYDGAVPQAIISMIRFQQSIPTSVLRIGVTSKMCMLICYLFAKKK